MIGFKNGRWSLQNPNLYFELIVLYKNTPIPKKIRLAGNYIQEDNRLSYFIFTIQKPITKELFNVFVW